MADKLKTIRSCQVRMPRCINLRTYNALGVTYNRLNKRDSNMFVQKELYVRNSLISRYPCPAVSAPLADRIPAIPWN